MDCRGVQTSFASQGTDRQAIEEMPFDDRSPSGRQEPKDQCDAGLVFLMVDAIFGGGVISGRHAVDVGAVLIFRGTGEVANRGKLPPDLYRSR
jgi:hypothetical protein